MASQTRRELLQQTLAAACGWTLLPESFLSETHAFDSGDQLRIAPFRFDVTPPMGHSCCGGWITPVKAVDDSLEAIGFVLLGFGKPIVLCAVDWTGLLNQAHIRWRKALAEAAGTTPERVVVQCVHQHNAPFACLEAEEIVLEQGDLPHIVEKDFYEECLKRGASAVKGALGKARPVTHIAHGQGEVEKVASNRRIYRNEEGDIIGMRGSSCRDEKLRAMTEGLIDPWLKTIAFYDGETKVAACHYYATHPMSYYGDGRVSSDFVGLARKKLQEEQPECTHIYFTGCSGNIAAGKYNDGSKEMRPILTDRVYQGMLRAEKNLTKQPIRSISWKTVDVLPAPNPNLSAEDLMAQISDSSNRIVNRNRPSDMLSWLRRVEQEWPIILSSLQVNNIAMVHLPAECFIEYQLKAQEIGKDRFVAVAAYGDGGPWYIPVAEEYDHGGYEVSVAFCDPTVEDDLTRGMWQLLLPF